MLNHDFAKSLEIQNVHPAHFQNDFVDARRDSGFDHPRRGDFAVPWGTAIHRAKGSRFNLRKNTYSHRCWFSQPRVHEFGCF